ncbi:MAG: altronate hydrolase [Brevundimonas sp.]|nr:MAG: altronate hydrolase [Brevundimonas sp.]
MTLSPVLLLSPRDNVLVCRVALEPGVAFEVAGDHIIASAAVPAGHKVARLPLNIGDKVIKHGAAIGSITAPVAPGEHVHLHNMKSDYIATHSRETVTERRAS